MNCRDCNLNLSAYLDGELGRTELQGVRSHLEACARCRSDLAGLKASTELFQSHVRELELSPALWGGVRARVATLEQPSSGLGLFRLLRPYRWVAATAGLAAALMLGLFVVSRRPETPNAEADYALQQYMNTYIASRDDEERSHLVPISAPVATQARRAHPHEEYRDNPFAQLPEEISVKNPFVTDEPPKSELTK